MRIFYAVPRAAWVELNLKRSLEAMGHQLIPFTFPGWPDDADPDWRNRGKPETNDRLVREFRAALDDGPIDLLYGYFYSSVVYPETVDLLRHSGVPTVNFTCNNVHQFDLVAEIAPQLSWFRWPVWPTMKPPKPYARPPTAAASGLVPRAWRANR